ncbi:unnamed protein product [Nezara viridula]|uniref:Uncharacterized protein n=1 Tax=Nezara viridula TaxID=85310 RepID=A0A9P0HES8_NEZVI|nr:unnamed protein product [Nezara viridula]
MQSSHLRFGLPLGRLPFGTANINLLGILSLLSPTTLQAHLIRRDEITSIILPGYISRNSALCNRLNSPVNSSFFGPNILRNTLFSKTIRRCSSLNVSGQVSHP